MQQLQFITGTLIAIALGYWFYLHYAQKAQALANTPQRLFGDVITLLEDAVVQHSETTGVWKLQGSYLGHVFQLKAIADTLAVRKLPSLWLMVTLPEPQPITAVIDMVLRPTGPTTFSKFDFLPHTLSLPVGFPEHAVIRSDHPNAFIPSEFIRPHLDLFHTSRGKELLISPKGLRLVVQAAEADRARYGVYREASFGDRVLDAQLARTCMDTLLALQQDLIVDDH
jgi:hypothetical protein